ncbi:hypothetical protein HNQ46_001991 [Oribacterium sinus]|jgi:hypothetical protein|uniref:Uncharacterized protein n=2 Tax=Oribacterium sinus TaxID=237576 RepID=C2KYN6_9FIRM|nr:hypothetical protein [Oribacterium sinus]EEJ51091.1 hypothetical protein HMPREF6123_1605 [Oribacterium sinus F0268]MBB6041996.1 hypothetical protein [Oribacterium sinus]
MTKEEASLKKKTNLEITIDALREVEQLKNTPNKKSYSSFAELLKDIEDEDIYEELERSEEDIAAGRTISGNEALKELREKYGL